MKTLSQRLRGYVKFRFGVLDGMDLIDAANRLDELSLALSQAIDVTNMAAGWLEEDGHSSKAEWLRKGAERIEGLVSEKPPTEGSEG